MMNVGETQTWERTFTEEDVRLFGQVSQDYGSHHVFPNEQGRLMVHGLLTATLPTRIGGCWNYIAHEISFEFVRPVFVGDTVRCEVTITDLAYNGERFSVHAALICRNQQEKIVLRGNTSGIINTPPHCELIGLH